MRGIGRSGVVVSVVALSAGCIDVELDASAIVLSTLAPSAETERFVFAGAADEPLDVAIDSTSGIDFGVTLRGPDGAAVALGGTLSDEPGRWSLARMPLPANGSYTMEVTGDRVGDYRMRFRVGKGAKRTQRLDLRPSALGEPAGGETAVSRTIPAGGGTLAVLTPDDRLEHASVTFPDGALRRDTRITIASAAPPALSDPGETPAGPAMRVEPPLRLGASAEVRVRFRDADLPLGAQPTDVGVLLFAPGRKPVLLTPSAVDAGTRVLSVTTDRLGTFLPVVARGAPRLAGRSYWEAGFVLTTEPAATGDSRGRTLWAFHGKRTFSDNGRTTFDALESEIRWTHDDLGRSPVEREVAPASSSELEWTLAPDGRTVTVSDGGEPRFALETASDGSLLVPSMTEGPTGVSNWIGVTVERDAVEPPDAYYSGDYWLATLLVAAWQTFEDGPVGLELGRQFGTLTLRDDGTWSSTVEYAAGRADGDGPPTDQGAHLRTRGTWSVVRSETAREHVGAVRLLDENGVPVTTSGLLFGARGRVCVGVLESADASIPFLWAVGVRREKPIAALFDGTYRAASLMLRHESYDHPARTVADLATGMETLTVEIEGRVATLLPGALRRWVRRDEGAPDGVLVEFDVGSGEPAVPCSLRSSGKWTLSVPGEKRVGAMTADCDFGIQVLPSDAPTDPIGVVLMVRAALDL